MSHEHDGTRYWINDPHGQPDMRAVVVGAGIGGLTTAIALGRLGWDVQVLERAQELSEVGAGVQIGPNGTRILERLGVMAELESVLFEPEAVEIRNGISNRRLIWMPMRDHAVKRWGGRYIQVYRPDLIAALARVLGEVAPLSVQTGVTVTGYRNVDTGAVAIDDDGCEYPADLVIGADGIHSVIRTQMHGADHPRFTGNIAWRCVVPVDRLEGIEPPMTGCVWTGEGRHVVTTRMRQGRLANFVGIVEQRELDKEGWHIDGDIREAQALFGWNPVLGQILSKTDRVFRWALFGRPPLTHWTDGNVALVGDAAHPMLPSMAQGAVQAMEDADMLCQCLGQVESVARAGELYFSRRIRRASRVQQVSRDNLQLFHRRGAIARTASYGPMWLAGKFAPGLIQARYDWLYGEGTT